MPLLEQGVIGYLDEKSLDQWRWIRSAIEALNSNGEAFSMKESVRTFYDEAVFLGGLYHEFQIQERKRDIWVSTYTGAISFVDEAPADEDDG